MDGFKVGFASEVLASSVLPAEPVLVLMLVRLALRCCRAAAKELPAAGVSAGSAADLLADELPTTGGGAVAAVLNLGGGGSLGGGGMAALVLGAESSLASFSD